MTLSPPVEQMLAQAAEALAGLQPDLLAAGIRLRSVLVWNFVGLDITAPVRESATVAMWASAAVAAGLLGGIPYVRWSAAREAARPRG
ncbi:hypothetical protein [Streptomyces sp. Isolate_45]|uniref:hypothetical protein n=1 Tax=Streptomyces sp. Isolate_45 TaxID=2950111 RepID=UPI002481BDDD|nr:hypothetical protein [Streptomyces sp. Isolate_45]MDA5284119.1 hypothetical protein [Streptomyces sp. Isolate_45]